ncbi:anti-sigma factor antagonist [Candidatus Moduliflexus flocculans]|uniref:Anti-sigma factor antagonist n=1 Tax=Candidatus Moduliflexus flocculans TaxID=1499966 RepID=A0A0S6VS07_9BACT|nr:anti-sigma factor antagonist [Candidatus Moduliflexus flocculans]
MTLTIKMINTVTVAEIVGDLDRSTSLEIQEQLLPHIRSGTRVLLDMSHVNYMSSAGLRMLLVMYREVKAREATIALAGLSERLKDIMAVTGFLKHFTVSPTVADGIAALRKESEPA